MTEEELDAIVAERGVMVKGINIRFYMYSLPCLIGPERYPILNEMCCRDWHRDGRISWLLDTHNFFFAKPDEMVQVVPVPEDRYTAEYYERVFANDSKKMNAGRAKRGSSK